ncbi:hypothetical protein [Roseovarius sp.]|uniref:hypothetical protein n=1 Tax=Roseovarius sp. TaxID=1486281 RepID=UPI003BA9D499
MRVFLVIALACLAGGASASSPIAEVICEPTEKMTQKLSRQFGEQLHSWGTRGPEQVMQVWTDKRGDWTMVVSYATGTSCIVAMGENWEGNQAEDPA